MLTKGIKTSELYVVLLFIGLQYLEFRGTSTEVIIDGVMSIKDQVAEIVNQLQGEQGLTGSSTGWLAMAYVIGRQLLKWREIGQGK